MKLLLTLLLLLPGVAALAQKAELAALLKKEKVVGLQLAYTKGDTTKTYSLGLRKSGSTQAVDANTIFQAASLGKVVLAYIALRLRDRGLLDLDKPLLAYGPYPRLAKEPRANKITARMALTHSSGLPGWAENPLQPAWKTSDLRLKHAPDSCWNYSGEGYVFLQKALEHITGKSFEALAQTEVFQPLQMKNSSFIWRDKFAAKASFGHDKAGKATEIRKFAEPYGAYSLLTNATDYNCFLQALMAGQGLQSASVSLLLRPANAANRCSTPAGSAADLAITWACGVGLATTSHGPALWHWGNNGDFQGFFMLFPDKRESLLFLTNSANGLKITDEVLRLFVGASEYWAMQWLEEEK
jgi:CubicO group peptidase (beta-lactamase class C family)